MKTCPFCAEQIPLEAKVCKFCSSTVVKKCPYCAEEVVASAVKCRYCQSDLASPGGAPAAPAPQGPRLSGRPVGEEREIFVTLLLVLVTCGIYGWVLVYRMGSELEAHQGKGQIKPGVDLLLSIVTCGLWGIWLMYKYPRVLQEITVEEELPPTDVTVPCLLLSIFGLQLIALAILQHELNQHWKAHDALEG